MKSKGKKVDNLYESSKTRKKTTPKKSKNTIDLDNEVIIGLNTPKKAPKKTNKKKLKKKKNKKNTKIIKWTSIILLLIVAVLILLFSDLFNTKEIKVINNQKISSQEILHLSTLQTEVNMFKMNKGKIINNIKTNPYIANVKVSRKLNGTVIIDVTERVATYMIELDNGYAYMNNQGYILEISAIKLEIPIIKGISTEVENIIPGNRLNVDDLKNLDIVIQIMKTAGDRNIANLITNIDVSDNSNYILNLESEKKTVYFGDSSSINDKILWIEYEITNNKGVEGTLFIGNIDKPYFRSKV